MIQLLCNLDALPPDERGRVFERIVVPWILRESPVYRDVFTGVWAWNDYRERHQWGADLGIDLIAEERTGRLWAVQAKAYAAEHDVTWSDISTFVGAAAARPEVGCLVLITLARSVGRRARHQLEASGKPSIILDRERLLDLGLPEQVSLADLVRPLVSATRAIPRQHQLEAIEAAVRGFESTDRGQIIHACGTGKTLTSLWIKEALSSRRTIVFCPSLSLVDQTLREWQTQALTPFAPIVVCSDESIGGSDSEEEGMSALELALPPTTHAEKLRDAINGHPDAVVVFATYQSSAVVAAAMRGGAFRFDLLIADEAHRTTGLTGSDFHRPLDDDQIGADRRLFITATPRIYTARETPNAEGDAVKMVSMDDLAQYGPRFHQLSFGEAIERQLLSDYRVVIIGVTPGDVEKLITDRAYVTHDGIDITDAVELATHVGLARAMREFGMRRTISFHSRVTSAQVFATRFRSVAESELLPVDQRPVGVVWTAMLSGKDPVRRRRDVLQQLKQGADGRCGLVTNARCLSEGVDVPALDGIAFVDPKHSHIDIVQSVGRAIRKSDQKSGISTIVLPIVVPDGANQVDALDGSRYAPLWRVIDALRSHDTVLGDELDALRRGLAITHGQRVSLPPKIVLRLPAKVSTTFAQALSLRILEHTTSSWELGYAHLAAYHAAHGDARVPQLFNALDGTFRLGAWVNTQRTKADRLSPDRRNRLDALGFTWDVRAADWDEGYGHLVAYHAAHRDTRVARSSKSPDGSYPLGDWVNNQRAHRRALTRERRERLDALGFDWDPLASAWDEGYGHLLAYHVSHGDAKVPVGSLSPDGTFPLGRWVNKQRTIIGKIAPERRRRLDALGFDWDPRTSAWEEGYRHLAAYHVAHGDVRVPAKYRAPDSAFALGMWVCTQRTNAGALTTERRDRLNYLGFDWDPLTSAWDEGYGHLVAYHAVHGDTRVPQLSKSLDGSYQLGTWVGTQRAKAEELSSERRKRLDALGFTWDVRSASWDEGYGHLVAYHAAHGDTRVPDGSKSPDGTFSLGTWVANQRAIVGKLSPERRQRLDALGFDWDPIASAWNEGYGHLVAYHAVHGDAQVPVGSLSLDGTYRLGQWVRHQRTKAEEMSPERRKRLDALGFTWDVLTSAWNEGYGHLAAYYALHGDSRVPDRSKSPDGTFSLGTWVANQRAIVGKLSPERRQRLDALGFVWDPFASAWDEGYGHLVAYYEVHGDTRVPQASKSVDGKYPLGTWVAKQRRNVDKLSPERRERLEGLGFTWNPHKAGWEEGYRHLAAYRATHGDTRVPIRSLSPDGTFPLGRWVNKQRSKVGEMSSERRKRLDELGFDWQLRKGRLLEP